MAFSSKQHILNILSGKPADRTPVGLFTTAAPLEVMEICHIHLPEADHDPVQMAGLARAVADICGFETISYPFDGTVVPEASGCKMKEGSTGIPPSVLQGPDMPPEQIIIPADLMEKGRVPVMLKASEILAGQDLPVICGLCGPVDLAAELLGMKEFLIMLLKKPDLTDKLLKTTTTACSMVANECLRAGADVVKFGEAVTSPGIIPPGMFRDIIRPHYEELNRNIKGKCVAHVCGPVDSIIEELAGCGFCGISVEESVVDLRYVIERAHAHNVALIGNVSTVTTLYNGKIEDVKSESLEALKAGVDILAPGCGIAPASPVDNLRGLRQARDEYCELIS